MKKLTTSLFLLTAVFCSMAQSVSFKAKSGDNELDVALNDINVQASADLKVFKKDLSVSFGVTEGKLDELSVKFGMQPGDMYFALEIAKQTGKTVDVVAQTYKTHKAKGWGAIAKELGIKPGSKEFHALKNSAKGKSKKMKEKKSKGGKDKGTPDKGSTDKGKANGGGKKGKK
jgi:hypothetical protein